MIISDGRRVIISDGIPGCILLYRVLNLIWSKIICNAEGSDFYRALSAECFLKREVIISDGRRVIIVMGGG